MLRRRGDGFQKNRLNTDCVQILVGELAEVLRDLHKFHMTHNNPATGGGRPKVFEMLMDFVVKTILKYDCHQHLGRFVSIFDDFKRLGVDLSGQAILIQRLANVPVKSDQMYDINDVYVCARMNFRKKHLSSMVL